ncbi:hypothetical protein H8S95_11495 [Pontibacter sp. KCTC 32443]|nr:hypothetical protein [Pontibacter sp. KCTC 32443]
MATDGTTRIVYGEDETIFCATSSDNGQTFSQPEVVGKIPGLLLGMSMGPQIASSANYTIVTAIDKKGNIHSFSLKHGTDKWVKAADINDVPKVAVEGLMSVASDDKDNFYAVWLDVRNDKKNKIVLASTSGAAGTWSPNRVVYQSPDSTVCECCKPSINVKGEQVTLMFRNWVNGSRDFYYTSSKDKGQHFSAAEKLGNGTWKLEGCPMDGGSILVDENDEVHTTWQREGKIFYAKAGSPEVQFGKGRNSRICGNTNPVIVWQDKSELKLKALNADKELVVGNGSYIEAAPMPDNTTLCVWENEKKVYFKRI